MTTFAAAPSLTHLAPTASLAERRADVLRAHGADDAVVDELLVHNLPLGTRGAPPPDALRHDAVLDDEPFVAAWRGYAAHDLPNRLVQLRFPVAGGTSDRADYQAATRRGVLPSDAPSLLGDDALTLTIHPTLAGHLPIVVARERAGFVTLVQALLHRNEPVAVPASMGACVIAGYVNWDRVRAHEAAWRAAHPDAGDEAWRVEFAALRARKELYQDRFVVLSDGPYSGVPASAMELDEEAWRALSLTIRLEHECAHYFTRRAFGAMRVELLDELVADYAGVVAATSRFRADWGRRFLGLERFPDVRADGRLVNYLGAHYSPRAVSVLTSVVVDALATLEALDALRPWRWTDRPARAARLLALSTCALEELAQPDAVPLLAADVAALERALR